MLTRYPVFSRLLLFVIFPLVILLGYSAVFLTNSVPSYGKNYAVNGLDGVVEISRNDFGIPQISGSTDLDVFFAMGFVQAQDRLWQMEVQRRIGQGRLAEVFGQSMLSTDITMRTYGLALAAEQGYQTLPDDTKAVLEAYSRGVNSWIEQQAGQLPPEFSLFALQPEPWQPEHSVLIGKLLAFGLAFGIRQESDRLLTAAALNTAQFNNLYPGVLLGGAGTTALAFAAHASQSQRTLERLTGLGKVGAGSNAWVVAGRHTESGKPILANDPHLALPIPSAWYQASLKGPTLSVTGMTMPGLPVILFGHNQYISWGGTNLPADTHDYVIEQLDAGQPNTYKTADGWQALQLRQETIVVRPEAPAAFRPPVEPVMITVASTEHGPLIGYQPGDVSAMALKWTALSAQDSTITAVLKLNYASDWQSFRAALKWQVAPTINYLYADHKGNIGYSAAGQIPIRRNATGIIPTTAQDFGWVGMIPWSQMPQQLNPVAGYIVNANQNQLAADYPYFISYDWAEPARAQRIEHLLQQKIASGKKLNVQDMQDIQTDQVDVAAVGLIRRWCAAPAILQQYQSLCGWNGDMQQDPAAAALYQVTLRHLSNALFSKAFTGIREERLQQRWLNASSSGDLPTRQQFHAVLNEPALWCAPEPVACYPEITQALAGATDELNRRQGTDARSWNWSQLAPRVYMHTPFSRFNATRSLFERKEAGAGSSDTVNVGGYLYDPVHGYQQDFGASFRQVITAQQHGFTSYAINSTGQSGHWVSSHYDDMIPLMSTGKLLKSAPPAGPTSQLRPLQ